MGRLRRALGLGSDPRVALFVDGPNLLRDEFDVDLDDVRGAAEEAGQVVAKQCFLSEHATPELVKAVEARGFEVEVTSGDVDVALAVAATELVCADLVDVLAIASRDADFKPVFELAGRKNVRTLAIAPGRHGRSDALRNAATDAVTLSE